MQISPIASANDIQTPWVGGVVSHGGVRVLETHEVLFREGDETTGFYEVLSGAVRAYKIFADGRRQIVSFAFAGDIVGFGHGETCRFDCDALGTTSVRAVPKSSLLRAMRERPELGEKLLEMAAGQVATMQDLSILLCRKSAMERISTFLITMATRNSVAVVGQAMPLPMCRVDIADYLGLTIETVSRNMTRLRAMQVIGLPTRGSFVVRDLGRLRELADGDETVH